MSHRVSKNVLRHLVRSLLSDLNLISDVGVFTNLEKSFGMILSLFLERSNLFPDLVLVVVVM